MDNITKYKQLQDSVNRVNSGIATAQGRKQEVARQLKAIFDKYQVTKMSELQAKQAQKQAELDEVSARAQEFVTTQQANLNRVESILMKEPEQDIIGNATATTTHVPPPALGRNFHQEI